MRRLILSFCLLLSTNALAVPTELVHQGRLFDSGGLALSGTQDLSFALYDTASGGSAVWSEDLTAVPFDNGYFSVQLGQTSALDSTILDGSTLYLGITVNSGAEMTTRVPLLSVPYAVRAGVATSLAEGGAVDTTEVRVNGPTLIAGDGSIDASHITGLADQDTLRDLGCDADDVAFFSGGAWTCVDVSTLTIDAGQLVGTVDISQLPTGTGANTVAQGDHGHTAADVGALPASTTAADLGAVAVGDVQPGTLSYAPVQDCATHLAAGASEDGLYRIDPDGTGPVEEFIVFCDQTTAGGGWMRFSLEVRQWGNTQGFATDPLGAYGARAQGANSQSALDNLTACTGDSQVAVSWTASFGEPVDSLKLAAINGIVSEGMAPDYWIYDADGAADWDQIKGCDGATVVMTGDGSELGAGANHTWVGPYAVDSFTGLFDVGIYAGNSDQSGQNASLPRYWYLR